MLQKQSVDNTYFGFHSAIECVTVFLGLKNKSLLIIQLFIVYMGIIASIFDCYVFHPYQQYYVVIALLIIDNITGILVAIIVKKEGFSTKKCQRFIFLLIGYTLAMSGSFWMSTVAYFYEFLPSVVFYYLSSVLFLSALKNLSILNWLPLGLNVLLKNIVDKRKDELVEMTKNKNI